MLCGWTLPASLLTVIRVGRIDRALALDHVDVELDDALIGPPRGAGTAGAYVIPLL
jgi:hypothetical protein